MDPRRPLDDHPALAELARRRAERLLPDDDEPDFQPPPGSTHLIVHLVPRDGAWAIAHMGISGQAGRPEAAPSAHERMTDAVLADQLLPLLLGEAEALLPARGAMALGVGVALARSGNPAAGEPTRWFFRLAKPTMPGAIDSRLHGPDAFYALIARIRVLVDRLGPLTESPSADAPWWKVGTEKLTMNNGQVSDHHHTDAILQAPDARSAALLVAARHAASILIDAKADALPPDPLPINLRYVHIHCPPSAEESARIADAVTDLLRSPPEPSPRSSHGHRDRNHPAPAGR